MNARNPSSRVLFFVAVFLFGLPAIDAHAQKTGELPRTPGLGTPAPGRVLTTPDFKLPTQDKGGVERTTPIIREGLEEQRKGLEPGGPSLREPIPAILVPSTREPTQPKGDQHSLYWDTVRAKWDWDSILRDARRAYAIEVLMKEIEGKGKGQTKRDPEGYFYDGTYYADDLPKWRATQDGFLDRLRTLPKPVLRSAVLRVGIEGMRPPPTRFGPGRPFFNKPDLPPGGLKHLRDEAGDEGKEENPYIMIDEGKWDIAIIAKDIMRARAVALALADIGSQGDSTNPDMASEFGQPVFTEDDLPVLEGFQISVEYFLGQVPLDIYGKAWNEANKFEDKGRGPSVRIDEVVINVDPRVLQLVPGFDPHPRGDRTTGQPDPWGGGPSPGPQRPPQSPVVATPGQGGGGEASSFLRPGQGGTLVGRGGGGLVAGPTGGGYSPWGSSQKGGGGSGGDLVGVRGKGGEMGAKTTPSPPEDGDSEGSPETPGAGSSGGTGGGSSAGGSVPPNPYDSVPENPYGDDSEESSGSSGSSDSGGSGRVRGVVTIGEVRIEQDVVEESDLPPDPETGGGKGGGDDLNPMARLLSRVPGHRATPQERDLVGPAFRKTTGADDKERPVTGGTSGSVSTNPSESETNDLGGPHMPRRGGGGEGGSAFEALMKKLGLWEKWQAGGPDPPK